MTSLRSREVRSVVEQLARNATQQPTSAAIRDKSSISYGELWERVLAAADYFSNRGVGQGDRVLLAAVSQPAFAIAYFATHLSGGVAVPIDPAAPRGRREQILESTDPVLAICSGPTPAVDLKCPIVLLDELRGLPTAQRDFDFPKPEQLADLIFTTGTTGRPKGVQLTHGNLAAAVNQINSVIQITEQDVEVLPLPLNHSFGLGRLRCVLTAGASLALVDGFRLPGEVFSALARHQATGLVGVPAGMAILLRFGARGLGAYSQQLRYIEIGSAPMPLEQKQLLMSLLPNTSLFMHYGLTEASRSAFIEFHRDRDRLDSVGLPAPGVQIDVRDDTDLGDGVGRLWVSGPHVSPGYWQDPQLTAASFVDGWVCTGDMAQIDSHGYVRLFGRQDDVVNVGGFKVWPEEVERVLSEHPAVEEAACLGLPDPRGIAGQVIGAFLVGSVNQIQPADEELARWASERLESYKVPVRFTWTSHLPRTVSGKLLRTALRDQAITTN